MVEDYGGSLMASLNHIGRGLFFSSAKLIKYHVNSKHSRSFFAKFSTFLFVKEGGIVSHLVHLHFAFLIKPFLFCIPKIYLLVFRKYSKTTKFTKNIII